MPTQQVFCRLAWWFHQLFENTASEKVNLNSFTQITSLSDKSSHLNSAAYFKTRLRKDLLIEQLKMSSFNIRVFWKTKMCGKQLDLNFLLIKWETLFTYTRTQTQEMQFHVLGFERMPLDLKRLLRTSSLKHLKCLNILQ